MQTVGKGVQFLGERPLSDKEKCCTGYPIGHYAHRSQEQMQILYRPVIRDDTDHSCGRRNAQCISDGRIASSWTKALEVHTVVEHIHLCLRNVLRPGHPLLDSFRICQDTCRMVVQIPEESQAW